MPMHPGHRCCARWSSTGPSSTATSRCRCIARADANRGLLSVEGTARVSDVSFSPNRVEFNVFGGPEPAKLLLNYNWAPGWSSTAGPIALMGEPGKLATVTIPPGFTGRYAFSFTPPGLSAGRSCSPSPRSRQRPRGGSEHGLLFRPWPERVNAARRDHLRVEGSATTIAIASPFGDTASLLTAPSPCAAASKTSVHPLAPRVHE